MPILGPASSVKAAKVKTMVIAGRIAADGSVTLGSGFTCALSSNVFTITFTHKLSSILAVTATMHKASNVQGVMMIDTAAAVSAGTGTVKLIGYDVDATAAAVDGIFDFIAVVVLK